MFPGRGALTAVIVLLLTSGTVSAVEAKPSSGSRLVAQASSPASRPAPPAADKPAADKPAAIKPAAVEPAAVKPVVEKAPADDDDDDFDDETGPVDRKPRISGVIQASYRATFFTKDTLPNGKTVDNSNTFQVEHTHLKFSGDLTHKLSWEVMPCVTHMNSFSVIVANFSYKFHSALQLTFGRFLLPFGQFNARSLPGSYLPVSRPLLYASHEDRMVTFADAPDATPHSLLFTPRDSLGLKLNGSVWFGPDDVIQVSYSGYVTNGLRAASNQMNRFWDDNNQAKQFGGRLSASYNGDKLTVSAGASGLINKYEASLKQDAWAIDATISYAYRPSRRVTVRGEYANMTREIQPGAQLLAGDESLRGAYVTLEADVTGWLSGYYQWDVLRNVTPMAQLDEGFRDVTLTTNRHAGGLRVNIAGGLLQLKAEYSYWIEPQGLPNAHRIAAQTLVVF